jgi:acyl carrier protein
MPDTLSSESVLLSVQQIVAEVTGNEIADVHPDAELEEELGVTPLDMNRIILELNKTFGVILNTKEIEEQEVTTVRELAVILAEEALLG